MPRRVYIIANPTAGGGAGKAAAEELARQLAARSLEPLVYKTQRAGDAREQARQADPEKWDAVVAVGGDGTVNEVLNGLPDLRLRLGVLPLGTANVLATELGLSRNPADAAQIIDDDHTIDAAVGLANGHRFLLFAGIGLDARAAHRFAERRRGGGLGGKAKWIGPVARTVLEGARDRIRVTCADGEALDDLTQVLVTRIRNYGGWFTMPGEIDIEDGALHVFGFRQRSRFGWACLLWRAWRGTLRPGRDVTYVRTRGVRVEADEPVPVQIDGDAHRCTPTWIRIEPTRARLLVPR